MANSPAEQYLEPPLDLNELLVKRPAATFFVRVEGDTIGGMGTAPVRSLSSSVPNLKGVGRGVASVSPTSQSTTWRIRA